MAHPATLPTFSSATGLSRYLADIRKFPLLEAEQEYSYAKRWRDYGDREAAYHLVTSHLRLVAKIAMRYRGYGLPIAEIISEGNIGLMQAVKRFDPERGVRLATYAMWWIKASIQEYVLRSWSIVKMGTTAAQKKLFFNLRRLKSRISALDEGDMRPDQVKLVAEHLEVPEKDVIEVNRRLRLDASLNVPVGDDFGPGQWQDWLVDPAVDPEGAIAEQQENARRQNALKRALADLSARERRILHARLLAEKPLNLEDLAVEFRISRERVRQIEMRALQKVQAAAKRYLASDNSFAA